MRRRAPSQSTCAEPGSSFCWGPALQGSTSPSSSRSSTLGQADRARCEVRQPPTPPPPCARTSHPTCPTHGSRTFRPPCILPTRRLHPRIQPTPSAALVRRSSTLPVEPRCRLAPDAASPPMPPMPPRPDAAPDAASPPMPPRPRCPLAPDAASPPMPPRPRCCLAPDAAPDAASPPVAAPDAAPDAPSPRCHPRCLVPPVY